MPGACPEPGRRGGHRPGAGAKPGNLNALKHGRHSPRFRALAQDLTIHPDLRQAVIRTARRQARLQRQRRDSLAVLQWLLGWEPHINTLPIPHLNRRQHKLLARVMLHRLLRARHGPAYRD